jgi:ornithine cyclodeaminase/alanine dehydrogenase-like protein (mu-crystallin family)
LDDETLGKAQIFVESSEAAIQESGDVIAAGHISAEIGEVVTGIKPGRQSEDEITLFKSVGVAVEDIVAADLVYRNALNRSELS